MWAVDAARSVVGIHHVQAAMVVQSTSASVSVTAVSPYRIAVTAVRLLYGAKRRSCGTCESSGLTVMRDAAVTMSVEVIMRVLLPEVFGEFAAEGVDFGGRVG